MSPFFPKREKAQALGDDLRKLYEDTVREPPPKDMLELLARLP